MSDFNKDDYLSGMDDVEKLKGDDSAASSAASASSGPAGGQQGAGAAANGAQGSPPAASAAGAADAANSAADGSAAASDDAKASGDGSAATKGDDLTPLGKAKKEAADYLEALQRERAEFVNFRNRANKEQDRFRQHGIIDVLTALLPALDDLDRIREHGEMSDDLTAVANKLDRAFEKFGVEKFGEKGEDFDPTKHEAILHKPDANATKESVDTVVEAGYKVGDRVVRAARVVVASPSDGGTN
ncbi:MAG: nucleotide exchange factor GrpE [Bifidobacteriaceae bacterium]|jgi:molecular chaperone GrpE|nr:nucleotide exchange factor GrpE [Bifidobacteriaceae bacterium]